MTQIQVTKNPILPGAKFGKLTVLQRVADANVKSVNLRVRVRVQCTCGNRLTVPWYYLTRKQPAPKISCGKCERSIRTIHAWTYRCWYMMHVRCENPKHVAYKDYGGRGISVCERWHKPDDRFPSSLDNKGFERFLEDVGPRPNLAHSVDRFPNNDGNYEPGNVRWATMVQQRANQRVRV